MNSLIKISRKDLLFIFSALIAYCFVRGLGGSLWPFLIALIAAYLSLPPVQRLERMGVPRVVGTGIFLLLFIGAFAIALFYLIPYLWEEVIQFSRDAPQLFWTIIHKAEPWLLKMGVNSDNLVAEFKNWSLNSELGIQEQVIKKLTWLLGAGVGNIFGVILLWLQILMAPVFFFFIMGDFERFKKTISEWIPADIRPDVLNFMARGNRILAAFFRGQSLLAVCLGIYYSLALGILGLPYGFLIGFISGILSFIPYVGFSLGLVTSVAIGIGSGSWFLSLGAAIVYVGGQVLDGLYLSPRLVGKAVGLSPLGAILAAIIGANLFGFPGVLLGIPLAACTRELWLILKKN
jgi:predicted PurR-regulated permease PerM